MFGGLTACSSPNEFIRRVAGQSLNAREAIFRKDTNTGHVFVYVADVTGLCQRLGSGGVSSSGTTAFMMDLIGPDMSPEVIIGTYRGQHEHRGVDGRGAVRED